MKPTCVGCGASRSGLEFRCTKCGGLFDIKPDFRYAGRKEDNFPHIKDWTSLGEVVTPVVRKGDLNFKLDYFSPTYSYKDRGARTLISFLRSSLSTSTARSINEDSSGNAGASIAAYGSAAGLSVNIYVPEKTSPAKIGQIRSYGANIIGVKGSREDVQMAAQNADGIYASHVMMPEFRDGIRTLAYEIFDQMGGKAPDNVFVPVSAGTLLLGVHSGFRHLADSGEIEGMPNIVAVQTEQVSPLFARLNNIPFEAGSKVSSIADALVSMKPPLINLMAEAMKDGTCLTVSEDEIIKARGELALAGMYVEYSSATVYAAYKKKKFDGKSLLVLTGNGLKNQP